MLKKQQILQIIELKKQHTTKQVSKITTIPVSTINYWIRMMKHSNIPVNRLKAGRKPLKITPNDLL